MATPDGERRDPQTAQQPTTDASARREDGPGSTPLRRSPPKDERRCDRGPPGVIASESGLTARLPRGTGPSVAQERRFNLRTRGRAICRLQVPPRARNRRTASALTARPLHRHFKFEPARVINTPRGSFSEAARPCGRSCERHVFWLCGCRPTNAWPPARPPTVPVVSNARLEVPMSWTRLSLRIPGQPHALHVMPDRRW